MTARRPEVKSQQPERNPEVPCPPRRSQSRRPAPPRGVLRRQIAKNPAGLGFDRFFWTGQTVRFLRQPTDRAGHLHLHAAPMGLVGAARAVFAGISARLGFDRLFGPGRPSDLCDSRPIARVIGTGQRCADGARRGHACPIREHVCGLWVRLVFAAMGSFACAKDAIDRSRADALRCPSRLLLGCSRGSAAARPPSRSIAGYRNFLNPAERALRYRGVCSLSA
jgi:hypothetical protein